jgi:hypothetical protein
VGEDMDKLQVRGRQSVFVKEGARWCASPNGAVWREIAAHRHALRGLTLPCLV